MVAIGLQPGDYDQAFADLPVFLPAPEEEDTRHAIAGGLIVSQMLTLYTTPVIYLLLDRLHRRLWGARVTRPAAVA
jgi:hypothetical protein